MICPITDYFVAHHGSLGSFVRASECDPLSLAAHRNLAELYESMGRKREALRHLGMVHRLTRS